MNKTVIMVAMALVSFSAIASDVEFDKNAGICGASYAIKYNQTNNPNDRVMGERAMSLASNMNRASQFGMQWIQELKRIKEMSGQEAMSAKFGWDHASACRKIGLR